MATSTARASKAHARAKAARQASERSQYESNKASLPADVLAFLTRCSESPSYFIEKCLNVVPMEGGDLVPFLLNPGQKAVVKALEDALKADKPARIIVLKSRRQGITTLCEGISYWATSMRPFVNGMVVAHKKDNTAEIFRIARLMYDTDERHKLRLAPEIVNSNKLEIRFGVDRKAKEQGRKGLNSALSVESSEGTGVARGFTLHVLHMSEVAFWTNTAVASGLMNALSKTPGSIGIMESTAFGIGNLFEKTWTAAAQGRNEWTPVFLPWSIDPNCTVPVSDAEAREWEFTDAYERDIFEKHNLSYEQLKFRRIKLESPECFESGTKPEDVFRREYPLTPEEAFITSGQCFFLVDSLSSLERSPKGAKKPLWRGRVDISSLPADRKDRGPIIRSPITDDYGELSVWEGPQVGVDYVLGADPAQGLEHRDLSVAWVMRRDTLDFVARLKGNRFDADEFGQKCALLGWWYNTALVGIEINGPGVAANSALKRLRYDRTWFDRDIVRTDEPIHKYMGWRTTSANRRSILDRLEEEIRRMTISMPSEDFYDEARAFQLIDGRPEALAGKHDDEVMAAAITVQLHIRGGSPRKTTSPVAEVKPRIDPVKPKPNFFGKKAQIKTLEFF